MQLILLGLREDHVAAIATISRENQGARRRGVSPPLSNLVTF
jgi:hypothetical protein